MTCVSHPHMTSLLVFTDLDSSDQTPAGAVDSLLNDACIAAGLPGLGFLKRRLVVIHRRRSPVTCTGHPEV